MFRRAVKHLRATVDREPNEQSLKQTPLKEKGRWYRPRIVLITGSAPTAPCPISVLDDADLDLLTLVLGLGEVHGHPVAEVLVDLYDRRFVTDLDLTD